MFYIATVKFNSMYVMLLLHSYHPTYFICFKGSFRFRTITYSNLTYLSLKITMKITIKQDKLYDQVIFKKMHASNSGFQSLNRDKNCGFVDH